MGMQLSARPTLLLAIMILLVIFSKMVALEKDHEHDHDQEQEEENQAVLSACFTTGTSSIASATFSRSRRPQT